MYVRTIFTDKEKAGDSMKFLGEYNFEAASAYKDKFEGEGIFPTVDEVGGYFGASGATMGTFRPKLRLFVEDGDYDRAVGLIKDLERNFEKKVEVEGKEADNVMIRILIGILCVMGMLFYVGYLKGMW